MSNKTVSGIPSSDQASFGHNSDFHQKICEAILPYCSRHTPVVEIEEHLLNNLSGLCNTIKDLIIACNTDDEYQLRPEAMAGFIDSIICQPSTHGLTNNVQLAYFCRATAKNSSQDSHPELDMANSRLLSRGFFCVRVIIMMDCVGGGLLALVSSPPFSLSNGSANPPTQTVAFRFAPNRQSPEKIDKETNHV